MTKVAITRVEIDSFKREILESCTLLRLKDAAKVLAVHPTTVLRRIEEGKIAAYGDNRSRQHLRILASDLRDYVREMRLEMKENGNF